MTNRETVIGRLNEAAEYFRDCRSNASFGSKAEEHFLELQSAMREAAERLKAQEPQYVCDCAEMIDDIVVGKCPSCDRAIVNKVNDPIRFCKYCGQAVKWE